MSALAWRHLLWLALLLGSSSCTLSLADPGAVHPVSDSAAPDGASDLPPPDGPADGPAPQDAPPADLPPMDGAPPGDTHPRLFLDAKRISALRTALNNNREPWQSAFDEVRAAADTALTKGPYTVVANGGGHTFSNGSDPTDGDYIKALATGAALVNLGLAYQLTGDTRYSDHAALLLRTWCLDSATYMEPVAKNSGGGGTHYLYLSLPAFAHGADLIWDSPALNTAERSDLAQWFSALGQSAASNPNTGDIWRVVLMAAVGGLISDASSLRSTAVTEWKQFIDTRTDTSGQLLQTDNSTAMDNLEDNIMGALTGLGLVAQIGEGQGQALFAHSAGGRSVRKAIDHYAPYIRAQLSWPSVNSVTDPKKVGIYELFNSHYSGAPYTAVIAHWGRPMFEVYVLGRVTLTHGDTHLL